MSDSNRVDRARWSLGVNIVGVVLLGCGGLALSFFEGGGREELAGFGAVVIVYGLNLMIYYSRFVRALRAQGQR